MLTPMSISGLRWWAKSSPEGREVPLLRFISDEVWRPSKARTGSWPGVS